MIQKISINNTLKDEIETLQSVYSSQELKVSTNTSNSIIIKYTFNLNQTSQILVKFIVDNVKNNTIISVVNSDEGKKKLSQKILSKIAKKLNKIYMETDEDSMPIFESISYCSYIDAQFIGYNGTQQKNKKNDDNNNMNQSEQKNDVQNNNYNNYKNKKNKKNNKNNKNADSQNEFSYSLIGGDLFTSPESSSLCHCISRDLGMGKGIAATFKKHFGGLNDLRKQQLSVGECGILLRQNRYIYYMITKKKYSNKPSYGSITKTLEYMKNHAVMNNVKRISMPKIGINYLNIFLF